MRAVIFVIIIAVLLLLVAVATGLLHVRQRSVPVGGTAGNSIGTKTGRTPAFDVETGSVQVGTHTAKVKVPDIRVTPPANGASNEAEGNTVNHS